MLYETFGVVLAVQFNTTVWVLPAVAHVPGGIALITRSITTTLHVLAAIMAAVQADRPMSIFTANVTSALLTTPSAFRSQALTWIWAEAEEEIISGTTVR